MTSDNICLLWKVTKRYLYLPLSLLIQYADTAKILDEIDTHIANIIGKSCGCSITAQHIIQHEFSSCLANDTIVYRAEIVGTIEANSTQLLDILVKSLGSDAYFFIQGVALQIELICTNSSSSCELPSPSMPTTHLPPIDVMLTIYIGVGAAILLCSIFGTIMVLRQCIKKKRIM